MLRKQQREATCRKVLDAADDLFVSRGFGNTTIRDIAMQAGVSVGTVMAVGDKNALLVQVFDSHIATVHAGPRDVSGSTVTKLVALVRPFVQLFVSRVEMARCYAGILAAGTQPTALFHQLGPQLIEEFRSCLVGADQAQALYYAYVGIMFTAPARGQLVEAELLSEITETFRAICQEKGA